MSKLDEIILVVKRSILFEDEHLAFQGTLQNEELVVKIMSNLSANIEVIRRGDAEEDKTYKQPIPYVILKQGDKIFAYERLKGGGEVRLHNQWSIGVGGHMNAIEGSLDWNETLKENMERELNEELLIEDTMIPVLTTIGLINDDENEVGTVHLGILVVAELSTEAKVSVRETDQLLGHWLSKEELEKLENLEPWTKIALEVL